MCLCVCVCVYRELCGVLGMVNRCRARSGLRKSRRCKSDDVFLRVKVTRRWTTFGTASLKFREDCRLELCLDKLVLQILHYILFLRKDRLNYFEPLTLRIYTYVSII